MKKRAGTNEKISETINPVYPWSSSKKRKK